MVIYCVNSIFKLYLLVLAYCSYLLHKSYALFAPKDFYLKVTF